MKYLILGVSTLLIGFLAGFWESRGDALRTKGDVRALKQKLEQLQRECSAKTMAQQMTRLFSTDQEAEKGQIAKSPDVPQPSPKPEEEEHEAASATSKETDEIPEENRSNSEKEALEAVSLAWELRRAQAKQALVEEAELSEEESEMFEKIVSEMNDTLREDIQEMVESLQERFKTDKTPPSPREAIRWANVMIDTMIGTDDALLEFIPLSDRQGITPQNIDPTTYVNPDIFEPMAEFFDSVK